MPSLFHKRYGRSDSPYINRFLQPDTIVPNPANPQSWNRYSYVQNNPIGFNDPTGHKACGDGEEIDCDGKLHESKAVPIPKGNTKDKDKDGYPEEPDPTFPPVNIPESHLHCNESTYVECFYARELLDIDGTLLIDDDQFNQLLLALFYDIYDRRLTVWPGTNVAYDSPFYDAGGDAPGLVCFQGKECYPRSEVNYIAQGMLANAGGLTENAGKLAYVYPWKTGNYLIRQLFPDIPGGYSSALPSEGTLHWYEYGYNMYTVLYNSTDPLAVSTHNGNP